MPGKLSEPRVITSPALPLSGTDHWLKVQLRFSDAQLRQLDRASFRRLLSERLNAVGDALLARYDQQHGETER